MRIQPLQPIAPGVTVIHVHLSEPERRHFLELFEGAGIYKRNPNDDAKATRERMLMALESALWNEKVREIIGDHEVIVRHGVRPAGADRWERFGGKR